MNLDGENFQTFVYGGKNSKVLFAFYVGGNICCPLLGIKALLSILNIYEKSKLKAIKQT